MERSGGIYFSWKQVHREYMPPGLARGWDARSKMRREVTRHPVDRREFIAAAGSVTAVASARGAFLDHAVPGVGLTVSGPVREVRLYFDLGVIAALSSVQVIRSTGASIAASRPVNDPSDQQVVIVRLKRALPPGTYKVSWDVVTIDQRQVSGAYLFTVS
jgi:copper resistance protein C